MRENNIFFLFCLLAQAEQECDYEDWVPPERLYAIDILFIIISLLII